MINDINVNPDDWKKTCFIARRLNPNIQVFDDDGNEIIEYATPKKYEFNYQPINSYVDLVEFGQKASIIQKAVIPIKYKGLFKENDIAYLDDTLPTNDELNSEKVYGNSANYKLLPPRNGNSVIVIYFEKILER